MSLVNSIRHSRFPRMSLALAVKGAVTGGLLLGLASAAQADTVWIRSGTGKALPLPNVRVQKVAAGVLTFVSEASGNEGHKPLESISRIKLDDEAPFSAAEEAYESGDFKGCIEGYRKALDASSRAWVKVRSASRLVDAGAKASDLLATVSGYAGLVAQDPTAAANVSVTVPADASKDALTKSIAAVKAANASGLPAAQKDLLLNLLARLQTANKDNAGAGETLKALGKAEDSGPPAAAAPGTAEPAAAGGSGNRVKGDVKISEAKLALANKNYKQVTDTIVGGSSVLTEPDQQADALFLLAEAKAATAGTDQNALSDAAIAYMRVVANFKTLAGAPHVAESLLRTGQIEEKLGKTAEATKVYQDVTEEFKDSAAAKSAAENIARLAKAK